MIGTFTLSLRALKDDRLATAALERFFEAMVRFNQDILIKVPSIPDLYKSGVVYRRERPEIWKDIPTALSDGWDDCEGLSCWLAAELRVRRNMPDARVKLIRQPTRRRLWHAVVQVNGRRLDPSKRLGMRGSA